MKKAFLVVLMLLSGFVYSQDSISGSVTDENNSPIPGASIVVEGTNRGVVTDFDGNYSINASTGEQLTFSSLGFSSQTVTIGNQTQINISLATAVDLLDEVVVSGYQTQQRRTLSGAIGTVDTLLLSWIFTGSPLIGAKIALAEILTKMLLYYFHERMWYASNWGVIKSSKN